MGEVVKVGRLWKMSAVVRRKSQRGMEQQISSKTGGTTLTGDRGRWGGIGRDWMDWMGVGKEGFHAKIVSLLLLRVMAAEAFWQVWPMAGQDRVPTCMMNTTPFILDTMGEQRCVEVQRQTQTSTCIERGSAKGTLFM